MKVDLLLVLALGLANWFGTILVVESEFFRPLREWTERRAKRARRKYNVIFWSKIDYMIKCQMCAGTWVGLALAPFAPMIFGGGILPYIVVALLIKATGHMFLVLHKYLEELTAASKLARVAQMREIRYRTKEGKQS